MMKFANVYENKEGLRWVGKFENYLGISQFASAVMSQQGVKTLYRLRIKMKDTQ